MRIAVLAVQGAFLEHEHILGRLGAECMELRKSSDLRGGFDGLILPGGESALRWQESVLVKPWETPPPALTPPPSLPTAAPEPSAEPTPAPEPSAEPEETPTPLWIP